MGKLYGIGVGPGDPELLTLKAHRILGEADVIFCPEKETGAGSFAFDIIKGHLADTKAEIVNLVYPMHYHGEKLREIWKRNAGCIADYLKDGRTGAFITLGDPAVYSTFMYTLPYIEEAGVDVEVVPGIPSFCAVADTMKIPLVAWDEDLVVAPVRKNSSEDLGKILQEHDNVVLMKPSANQKALIEAIRENHMENKFVLVTKSGTGEERLVTDFEELKQYDIPYLSTVIIKKRGR
ncbi:precorrin-2 C(20)-methyltransferase [Clostridium sp. AM58-1XD]|uniref:precorrin-2 C(20)-methyltransferase n=1 Tax=Clostridium sp. AM58-1XD TaxID=2292307 RepID=UPI000E4F9B37|nr:precorrin-2 C(20)-methyltransferase [Clostridium sp. AM58-1XD]RGY99607.1 precorrin-2 C(20)-methyltransferase [Clostridium sp. AM58-1XD]